MSNNEVKVVIKADGSQLTAAAGQGASALRDMGEQAARTATQLQQAARGGDGLASTAAGFQAAGKSAAAAAGSMSPFIQALRDQVATAGKSEAELIKYRAAQAGVAAEAAPLVLQLQNIKAAMAAKAAEEAAAAQAARDQAAAVRAQAQAQQAFLASLRERAETAGLDPAGLIRYRAAQLGVEKEADVLIAKLRAQGAAGQVSAGQTAAAMRMLPAQLTDVVTQLQGGANPLTILLQQGGQVKDSFGGFVPMFRGIGAAVGPLLLNPLALAAAAAVALGAGLAVVMNDADRAEKSLALTGNAAGLTTGSFNSLVQATRAASGATSGLSRDAAQLAVNMGEFGPRTVGAVSAAMASYAKASGQSISEIAGQFSNLSTDAGGWAMSMSRQMNFLTGATYAQIRALQELGKNDEAAALAAQSLNEALKGREPQLSALGKAVKALKDDWDRMWTAARGSLEAETVDERLKKAQERVDALRQRSRVPGNAPGYLDIFMAKGAQSQLPGAEADLARAKAAAEFDRIIAAQDAARAQRNKDQTAAVDFINPMNKASSAQAVANLDLDVKRKWSAESQQIIRQYSVAIEAAGGDQAQTTALMNERNARLAEGGRRVVEELNGLANAQTAKARAVAAANIDLGLAGSRATQDAALRRLDAQQAAVDAVLGQGLITERQAAAQSLAIEQQRLSAKEALINAEIAAEQRRPLPVGDPAAVVQQQTKVAELRAQLAAVRDEAKQAPVLAGQKDTQLALNEARTQAQEYGQIWQSTFDFSRQLEAQNTQAMTALIRDPMARARAEAEISVQQLKESARQLRTELGNRIDIARGQGNEGQAQQLEAQMRRLDAALAQGVGAINADLARKLEPAWQTTITGWRNTTAMMRDEWDNTVGDITGKLQSGLANVFKGGKIDFKGMADSLLNGIANAQSKAIVGSLNIEGLAAKGKDAFGFNGAESASAAFNSLWQSIKDGTVIQDAWNLISKTTQGTEQAASFSATSSMTALSAAASSASAALWQVAASGGAGGGGGGIGGLLGSLFTGGDSAFSAVDTSGIGITNDVVGSLVSAGLGGGRAAGGPVYARTMHPVNERGEPELLTSGGAQYLMMPDRGGHVTPLTTLGASNVDALRARETAVVAPSVTVNPQIAVNIQNAPAGDHKVQQSTGPDGTVLIDIVLAEVANQAQNGGPVRDGIAAGFGLRPALSRIG